MSTDTSLAPRLVELTGPRPGHEHMLQHGVLIIGRGEGADVELPSPDVSRRHAEIEVDLEGATIRDLGSKNGVEIGEVAVAGDHRLSDGDRIQIGGIELELQHPSARVHRLMRDAGEVTATRRNPPDRRAPEYRSPLVPLLVSIVLGVILTVLIVNSWR